MAQAVIGIVGAGPVGMYTALRLVQEGYRVRIWDARTGLREHSRSIGIHPPAWLLLERAGLGAALRARARPIHEGQAWWNGRLVGRLDMTGLHGTLATLEQHRTEALLQEALMAADPDALRLDSPVRGLCDTGDGVLVDVEGARGDERVDLLIGCDGHRSLVRTRMGARWKGASYGIPYLMGDFPDDRWRHAAVIMLGRKGLVESFPLPGGSRRWVVRLAHGAGGGSGDGDGPRIRQTERLVRTVEQRSGILLPADACLMVSSFGVERREAVPMARGRMVLLGDAAHVVSPIGGQGMNLGWLEAEALVRHLGHGAPLREGGQAQPRERTAGRQARRFRAAARRAEFNMWMGAPCAAGGAAARYALLRTLMLPVVRGLFLRRFTMHGLDA